MSYRRVLPAVIALSGLLAVLPQARAQQTPSKPTEPDRRDRAGPEVDLRPRFAAGRLTRYEMSLTSANSVKSGEEEASQSQTMTQTVDLALKVKSVDDEGATLELVYERIRATLETDDFKAAFDSRAAGKAPTTPSGPIPPTPPKNPPKKTTKPAAPSKPSTAKPAPPTRTDPEMDELLGQIMRPMVGTTLTMQVDKQGNIKSVSGGDALAGAGLAGSLLAGLGGGAGAGGGGGLPMPTTGGGAGNPMSWMVNSPGQRGIVHVGETWTNTDTLGGTPIGGFKMVTRHTCNSVSETGGAGGGRTANLTFSGRADQESLGTPSGQQPATGFKLTETTYKGDYAWDLVKGELKNMTSTLKTAIEGKLTAYTTKMNADTRMTVKRLD